MSTTAHTLSSPRLKSLVIPREHGAWGILLVPLATGAAVGVSGFASVGAVTLLAFVALSLFWLRTPVESWLGAGPLRVQTEAERNSVIAAIALLGSVAILSASALLWISNRSGLLQLGLIAAVIFALQAALKKRGRRYYMAAELIGAAGLTATAPAAYLVATGRLDSIALLLWLANWTFASNQIHYVQLRIHSARITAGMEKLGRGLGFFLGQATLASLLLTAWLVGLFPALAALAFVPALVRGFYWFLPGPQPLAVRRLGWTELSHSIVFGGLLIAGLLR